MFFSKSDVRNSGLSNEQMPTSFSMATRGSEPQDGLTDVPACDHLTTPSTVGRLSFKGSCLPVFVGNIANRSIAHCVGSTECSKKAKP